MKDIEKIAFFLPTRKGSQRVSNKNTRDFAGIQGGLLRLKLEQLLKVPEIPIYLSTNDDESIRIANSFNNSRIQVVLRPEELCLPTTNIEEFINYVPTVVEEQHIFWIHVTSPFVSDDVYLSALLKYSKEVINGNNDSLMSVIKIQQFLWDDDLKVVANHDRTKIKWPQTQDLKPLYEINHAFYINSRLNYLKHHDRIGLNPFLYELNKVESIDIDWEEDFNFAEMIYEAIRKA